MNILADYFSALQQTFAQTFTHTEKQIEYLNIAGFHVQLQFAGMALKPVLFPGLAHLQTANGAHLPAVGFSLWDAASTGHYPPPPPFAAADYNRYGQRALREDGPYLLMHDPVNQLIFGYERTTGQGFFWAEDAQSISIYERAAPLQTLFHWALSGRGWEIIHAGALGTANGGVLLIGGTGAGKSTTSLACLQNQRLHYLSDDKCLVTLEPEPRAFGLFNSAKLKPDMLARLEHFKPLVADHDENAKGGKSLLYLYPAFQEKMVTTFPIRAILMTHIANITRPALVPISPVQVLRVLGPSTVIWLAGAETGSMRLMARLAQQIPCYRLELAQNPTDNLDLIADTLDKHS